MWRVRLPNGHVSDMVNLTRAKDAAMALACKEAAEQQRKVRGAKKIALDVLQKAINEAGSVPPASNHIPPNTRTISIEQWRTFAYQATITESDKPDSQRKAFVRAVNGLLEANLIGIWGDYVWII
jgi:diadenosine tetraphosphate (Ap4A) HIT family hydrolase